MSAQHRPPRHGNRESRLREALRQNLRRRKAQKAAQGLDQPLKRETGREDEKAPDGELMAGSGASSRVPRSGLG